jgi:hypothetical protein
MTMRGLELEQFVSQVEPAYFERYFQTLLPNSPPGFWALMHPAAMLEWMNTQLNAAGRSVVIEDFGRISEISKHGMNLLVQAYKRAGAGPNDKFSREQQGIILFLDHRDCFDFAWARHLFYSSDAKLSLYKVELDELKIDPESKAAFEEDLRGWFADHAKGDFCWVRPYEDGDQVTFLLAHGSYVKTVAYLSDDRKISFQSLRPVAEDILVYDRPRKLIEIKAALSKDRERYLQAFATCIVKSPNLIKEAQQREVLTLKPISQGTFDFAGDGEEVESVILTKIRMSLSTASAPVVEVKSKDIKWTFDGELGDLSLDSGRLDYARFRFHLKPDGRPSTTVSFEIQPPGRTDLVQKKHAEIIERYLEIQGVKIG